MRAAPRSITGRIMAGFFLCSTAILLIAGFVLSTEIERLVLSSMDRTLHSKLQLITGLLHEEHGGIELELSEIIAGEYVIPRSGHYYRVLMDGALLAASPSLAGDSFEFAHRPSAAPPDRQREFLFTSIGPDDERVRVLSFRHQAFGRTFEIILAESLEESFGMIGAFRRFLLLFVPVVIATLCFVAWMIAKKSLNPIARFSETVDGITHRNLSERVDAEAAARELSILAASFNDMLDRLNRVFASQKRLVTDASHELKTPLSVIRAQCDVALQRERTPGEYAAALGEIRSTTGIMSRLIGDMLSLARLDAEFMTQADFATLSPNECLEEAMRMIGPLAAERRVTMTIAGGEGIVVRGSRTGLVEAFQNLLENAVRYNRQGGSVSVVVEQRNGKASITISDTGIGFSKDDGERIFDRFYRTAGVRNIEGTGLGLSIVRSHVEAHGGTIRIESEPGKGSAFIILLPLQSQS